MQKNDENSEKIELYTDLLYDSFRRDRGIELQLIGLQNADRIFKAQCRVEIEAFYNLGLINAENDSGLLVGFTTEQAQSAEFAAAFQQASGHLLAEASEQELLTLQSNAVALAAITKPDWYTKFLGEVPVYTLQVVLVNPRLRGTGVFRRLMTPMIERCAAEARPVVLQTHNPANVPKYQHYGFELTESVYSDQLDITCFNMMRKTD